MLRVIGKLASLLFGLTMATPASAMAEAKIDTDAETKAETKTETESKPASKIDTEMETGGETVEMSDVDGETKSDVNGESRVADSPKRDGAAEEIHWQFGIAVNLYSYQLAKFDVEPINSGRIFPGTLERTNLGPSGGPVLIEPGYVLGNRLVLGLLIDLGSGLNESKVKGLSFEIAQSGASLAVGPRVAYLFAPSSQLRPFATLAFGYTTSPSKQADQGIRITEYQGFAGAGLAYFVAPAFSFDTSVRAAYGIGSGYVDTGVLKNAGLSGKVYTLMWTFGTSGWLR